jgi:arylsulfatase A-like enzyme
VGLRLPPNIIVILCDNLGYGDTEVYNPQARQATPRLKRMAAEGMVFTHAYSAAPVCTPSRAALMTGCYPRRLGLDRTPGKPGHVLVPRSAYGLHPDEVTVAELLRPAGYRSLCIGKWHLGDQLPFLPLNQGFDEFFGIPYSDDMVGTPDGSRPPLPLMEGNRVIEAPVEVSTLTRRCTERAVNFIEANRERPFFLYFPEITPGSTAKPPAHPDFQQRSSNGAWGDSVMELDWSAGEILDAVDRLGLAENTLVVWTNDNGAPGEKTRGGSSDPLKGEAYNVSEGGMRMPWIVRWKGRVPAGQRNSELITLMDLLPTAANLAKQPLPAGRVLDGRDITPLLLGTVGAVSPYQAFYYFHLDQLQAVRAGPWKLYLGGAPQSTRGAATLQSGSATLYHLHDDPAEENDRIHEEPEVVAELMQHAARIRQELGEGELVGPGCRLLGKVDNPTPRLLEP